MQPLYTSFTTHRRWWLLGSLGVVVLLTVLVALRACQAQPAPPERATAPLPEATAATPPVLRWNYTPAAPERFVVRRSLDGGTWQDVAVLPGASGTGFTWEDDTLPVSTEPISVKYAVYAVVDTPAGKVWSEASNVVVAQVGEEPPVSLGECVAVKRGKKKIIMTCTQP